MVKNLIIQLGSAFFEKSYEIIVTNPSKNQVLNTKNWFYWIS